MALQKADARTGTPVDLTVQDIQDIKSKLNLDNIDNQSFSQIENTVNSISAGEGGVIYDTLSAAQAVSPKPSDGTIFQVSEITDSANAGFYSFQSAEPNGTRFEKPFINYKEQILSEAYAVDSIVFDNQGFISSSNLTFPNGQTGTLGNVVTSNNGIESIDFTINGTVHTLSITYVNEMVNETNITTI